MLFLSLFYQFDVKMIVLEVVCGHFRYPNQHLIPSYDSLFLDVKLPYYPVGRSVGRSSSTSVIIPKRAFHFHAPIGALVKVKNHLLVSTFPCALHFSRSTESIYSKKTEHIFGFLLSYLLLNIFNFPYIVMNL